MSSYSAGAGIHLQNLILDNSTTVDQKVDCVSVESFQIAAIVQIDHCSRLRDSLSLFVSLHSAQLKLLKVVLKNLADPVKALEPKYRQLKVENPKVATKILPCPSALDLSLIHI